MRRLLRICLLQIHGPHPKPGTNISARREAFPYCQTCAIPALYVATGAGTEREAAKSKVVSMAAALFRERPAHSVGNGFAITAVKNTRMEQPSASRLIDQRIEELGDWRGTTLANVRDVIKQADPTVVEEWKWRGVPTWYHAGGIICTGETYKTRVKLTFPNGAALDDPNGLFNASLEGNTRRAIDFNEGDTVNEAALKTLIHAAVHFIEAKKTKK